MRMHVRNATKLVVEGRTSYYDDFSTLGLCEPLFSPFPCFFRSLYPSSSFETDTAVIDEMDCFRRMCFFFGLRSSSVSVPVALSMGERLGILYSRLVSEESCVLSFPDKNEMFYSITKAVQCDRDIRESANANGKDDYEEDNRSRILSGVVRNECNELGHERHSL